MIKQTLLLDFTKENKNVRVLFDHDTPLGILHDCLMEAKGFCVERMVQAQKEEMDIAEQYKKLGEGDCNDHCI